MPPTPSPAAALRNKRVSFTRETRRRWLFVVPTLMPLPPPQHNTQLLTDVRTILKNLQQWPTAAQPDSRYQTFIREQVGR